MALGQTDAALALLVQLLAGRNAVVTLTKLEEVLARARPDAMMSKHIVEAVSAADAPTVLKFGAFDALLGSGSPEERDERFALIAEVSGLHRYEWRHAARLAEKARPGEALRVLRSARTAGRASSQSLLLMADLTSVEGDQAEAVEILAALIAREPDRVEAHRKIVAMQQRACDFARAAASLETALERWPDDWLLVQRLNRLPMASDAVARCTALLRDEAASEPRYRLHLAIARAFVRDYESASRLMAAPFPGSIEGLAGPLRKVLHRKPAEEWRARARLKDDRLADVQVVPEAGATATVIVPTGVAFGLLPVELLDALLAEARVNAIYLRDFNKLAFMQGVAALGPDFGTTVDRLSTMAGELAAPRTVVVGCSSGGYAAHRIGAAMQADAAISFAGPVQVDTYLDDTRAVVWNEEFMIGQALRQRANASMDNRECIRAAPDTRFVQVYGGGMPRDVAQAAKLEGLPNVELVRDDAIGDHLIVSHMIADGRFGLLLGEAIEPAQVAKSFLQA